MDLTMSKQQFDVIIIGAGLGGLTSGALLANQGVKVLMLEQHNVVGGCASSFRRKKFVFDSAVHLIGGLEEGGIPYEILNELKIQNNLEICQLSSMYTIQVGKEKIELPKNIEILEQFLISISPSDEEAIIDTLQEIKEIGSSLLTMKLTKRSQGLIMAIQNLSIKQYLADRFINAKIEFIFLSLFPYIGAVPEQIPAPFYMATFMSYNGGGYYVKGSSQALSNALKTSYERDGGQILMRRRVEEILYRDNKIVGVRDHKGNEYEAPHVISNMDVRKTLLSMIDQKNLPSALVKEVKEVIPSISGIILYVAIENDGWERNLPHETFIFPNYKNHQSSNAYNPLDSDSKPWLTVSCTTHIDPSLAPEGHSIISIVAPCEEKVIEQIREEKGKEFIEERFWELLDFYIPGLRERAVFYEMATPRTVERYTGNGNGAIYGWKKSIDQQRKMESISRLLIPGLHIVGHWSKYGHGVFGAMNGGRLLATVLKEEISSQISPVS